MAGPVVVADLVEFKTFLGEAIADALAASRSGARDASDTLRRQTLEKARAKNWSTFLRGTAVCDVEKDEAGTRFFPARSGFQRRFVPTGAPVVVLDASALSIQLGAALKDAFRSVEPRRRVRSARSPARASARVR